jgi:hypothetical protein
LEIVQKRFHSQLKRKFDVKPSLTNKKIKRLTVDNFHQTFYPHILSIKLSKSTNKLHPNNSAISRLNLTPYKYSNFSAKKTSITNLSGDKNQYSTQNKALKAYGSKNLTNYLISHFSLSSDGT